MAKTKRKRYDIDDDATFDTSDAAKSNALDRQLIQIIERVDRLEDEKKGTADDIKDVWAEAKALGYDVKIAKAVRKLRNTDKNLRQETEALIETYKIAVGLD